MLLSYSICYYINRSHQHIIIKEIDKKYKWKPIREKNTYYYCFDEKASSNSLSPLFSTGTNLQEALSSILQATTCKEAPTPFNFLQAPTTGGSNLSQLQRTAIKLQLDREAPTSSIYQTESLLIYLRYQPCSVASPSVLFFFFNLLCLTLLYSAFSRFTLSSFFEYQDDIIYRFSHMTVCILLGI